METPEQLRELEQKHTRQRELEQRELAPLWRELQRDLDIVAQNQATTLEKAKAAGRRVVKVRHWIDTHRAGLKITNPTFNPCSFDRLYPFFIKGHSPTTARDYEKVYIQCTADSGVHYQSMAEALRAYRKDHPPRARMSTKDYATDSTTDKLNAALRRSERAAIKEQREVDRQLALTKAGKPDLPDSVGPEPIGIEAWLQPGKAVPVGPLTLAIIEVLSRSRGAIPQSLIAHPTLAGLDALFLSRGVVQSELADWFAEGMALASQTK